MHISVIIRFIRNIPKNVSLHHLITHGVSLCKIFPIMQLPATTLSVPGSLQTNGCVGRQKHLIMSGIRLFG